MSDETIRELERRARAGDASAEDAWDLAERRAGREGPRAEGRRRMFTALRKLAKERHDSILAKVEAVASEGCETGPHDVMPFIQTAHRVGEVLRPEFEAVLGRPLFGPEVLDETREIGLLLVQAFDHPWNVSDRARMVLSMFSESIERGAMDTARKIAEHIVDGPGPITIDFTLHPIEPSTPSAYPSPP